MHVVGVSCSCPLAAVYPSVDTMIYEDPGELERSRDDLVKVCSVYEYIPPADANRITSDQVLFARLLSILDDSLG